MAGEEFDGIPLRELPIDEVAWSEERAKHLRTRAQRKGPAEINIDPLWASEAALDLNGLVRCACVYLAATRKALGRNSLWARRDDPARRYPGVSGPPGWPLYLQQAISVSGEEVSVMSIAQCPHGGFALHRSEQWRARLHGLTMAGRLASAAA